MEASKTQLRKPEFKNLSTLQPGTRVNINVKVLSVKVTKEIRRYDGSWNRQAECVVGDEQGIMDYLAQNEQLDVVKEGATITVRNGHAKVLRDTGRIKLIVDKWGKVEASSAAIGKIKEENNISAVEYELVPAAKK